MKFIFDDGGRSLYFKGSAGDCVTRAIAIVTGRNYKQIYDELFALTGESPRNGVKTRSAKVKRYFREQGLKWKPAMKVGQGCTVHLRAEELPAGRLICKTSRHLVAVIDGVVHDTHDSTRDGNRCVYGFWLLDHSL